MYRKGSLEELANRPQLSTLRSNVQIGIPVDQHVVDKSLNRMVTAMDRLAIQLAVWFYILQSGL